MRDQNIFFDPDRAAVLRRATDQVTGSLDAGAQAGKTLAQALEQARAAAKALASASSKVKRVLAGFDQLNRLGAAKKSGSSSKKSSSAKKVEEQTEELAEQAKDSVEKVLGVLEPLEVPSYSAIMDQMFSLSTVMERIEQVGQLLQQLRQNVLEPLGAWVSNSLVPAFSQLLSQGLDLVSQQVTRFGTQLSQMWQQLRNTATQIAQGILPALQQLGQYFSGLVTDFFSGCAQIGNSTAAMGQRLTGAIAEALPSLSQLQGAWQQALGGIRSGASNMASGVTGALQSVATFLSGTFSKSWKSAFDGLQTPLKGAVNGIIGFLNKMLSGLAGALNGVIKAANQLSFKVPDWVPGIGGKQYGFSLKTVSVPQIPYLAQGAVLPANQPFLAVVGDQRHGTNVEAPLSTIQEAVAAVMADHTAGNMAGHEATVAVLKQILEAVLGMEIGEEVISRAAQSRRLKNAVMKGGTF